MNIKRFGRYLAILIFLIWISGSWTSLTPAQSRAELIQETLEICAGKIKKYSWDWVVSPNNHRIIDLSSSGGCGGFQLVLYTNSRYWGEASIYDCPDHPSAANIFQNLTYPPKTWSASLPSVRSTEDYTSVNSKEGSLYIFDQFIEFIEDANYAAWEGSHDPDFRYKQWFTIYKSTLANNLLVYKSMGPRTKTQSSLDSSSSPVR